MTDHLDLVTADQTVHAMNQRRIIKRLPVQPGLTVAIEDSHNILFEITTPDGSRVLARSDTLSNVEAVVVALENARIFVRVFEENPEEAPR